MTTNPTGRPSASQLRKAGSIIRKHHRGEASAEEFLRSLATVRAYRAEFAYPLVKLNNGLRGIIRRAGVSASVTQRLKREPTIIEKLSERETGLDLSRMQDIGGCRVVVDSIDELRTVQSGIERLWSADIDTVRDYIESPRESGYRAVHIVVRRDGLPVEVQLRTTRMHDWAELVENISGQLGINYKQDGDSPVQEMLAGLSELHQAEESSQPLSQEFTDTLREQIRAVQSALEARDESR